MTEATDFDVNDEDGDQAPSQGRANESIKTSDVKRNKTDILKSSWGERVVTAAVLGVISYSGVKSSPQLQMAIPLIVGVLVIIISISLCILKDYFNACVDEWEMSRSQRKYTSSIKEFEAMLNSDHITSEKKKELKRYINVAISRRAAQLDKSYNRELPESYTKIGDAISSAERKFNNNAGN